MNRPGPGTRDPGQSSSALRTLPREVLGKSLRNEIRAGRL
jgi:hypothetical protein